MSWMLIAIAIVLIGMGAEALVLSRSQVHRPRQETDKMLFGDPPPTLTDAARADIERRVVVRNGASTRVLGVMFVVLGLVLGAVGVGWL